MPSGILTEGVRQNRYAHSYLLNQLTLSISEYHQKPPCGGRWHGVAVTEGVRQNRFTFLSTLPLITLPAPGITPIEFPHTFTFRKKRRSGIAPPRLKGMGETVLVVFSAYIFSAEVTSAATAAAEAAHG